MDREKVKSAIVEISLSVEPFQETKIEPTVINFFYGKNGSGKTSISRAIKDGGTLVWKPTEPESEYERLVFNRDFIQQNLMLHDRLPGVFTISEADIAVQAEIKRKTEEKRQHDATAASLSEQLTAKKGEAFVEKTIFTESCWNISKTARTLFKQEMHGYLKDSKKLADYILEGVFVQGQRILPVDHGYEALQELHNTAYNSDAKTYPLFHCVDAASFPECDLLGQVITNSGDSPFATFIKTLGATSWVRQGHEEYHASGNGLCPYCMQRLPEKFEEEFAACFDQQYQANMSALNQFLAGYRSAGLSIHKTLTENTTDCFAAKGLDAYKDKLAEFVKMMQDNLDLIREKVQDPTKKIVLHDIGVVVGEINAMIAEINAQIQANNDIVNAQADKQKECMRFVWEQLLFDLQEALTRYNDKKKAIAEATKTLSAERQTALTAAKTLETEITDMSQTNSNTQAAIVSINSRLRDAGFDGFFIREKEDEPNMYEVVRSSSKKTARNLSEGEINFIAFLYFYHLVYGSDKAGDIAKKKIVVIDDPVSSMDSDVLFLVGALVRDLIEICRNNVDVTTSGGEDFIKQIFILTHNAYFHQEVSYNEDLLGTNDAGGIKAKNEFIHTENWDLVIFDEYHFGAWRENAKKLFENPDEEEAADFDAEKYGLEEAGNAYNETFLPITTGHYLFLSGTPFRAINSGEFIEDQIYNWTYSDEQRAKENWVGSNNPYASLPRMVMLTYRIPDSIRQIAMQGEFNEFDLNVFFSAKGKGNEAKFVYENEVQKWLDLIRGSYLPSNIDDMKLGQDKRPPMPYSDTRLLNVLSHTLWFLPNVASCQAMYNLMMQKQNAWFNQRYRIHVCAGTKAGIGLDALAPVQRMMDDPLKTQTITLSCGKLTTGVTVKPWTGVFMLRNLKSPETYFQTAFRVQSPWVVKDEAGNDQIMKQECYVFDFALDRALRQISDYSCRLDVNEANPEKKVAEFINFLPVLAYDGSSMRQISAQDVLDIAMAGTSATLLAKRWESALLVNVDNDTLTRLMASKEAMDALMSIEGFRSLNQDIQTIINKSEAVKKAKKEGGEKTPKEKKELSDEEKEYKSMRKKIQEKLIKFATRVPVFMYLTDYRERSLKDVITQLEPGLFKKVTGLDVKDFELLCSLGVFNANLMNDAIFKFKRYEDSSLSYTGIDKHEGKDIGGWDTVIKRAEYDQLFYNQQATMEAPTIFEVPAVEDIPVPAKKPVATTPTRPTPVVTPAKPRTTTPSVTAQYDVKPAAPAAQTAKPAEFVAPDVKDGSVVIHKTFGEGTVTKIDKAQKHIRVTFAVGEKTFIFPDAFKMGFLKMKE